ncbi:MAG: hypothetical protein WCB68_13570 [Pyrinomonadaceae bacterium]
MSQRVTAIARRKRRRNTLIWIVALAALIIGLLYYEQTALLYVLATLGVTALLVVVALADLSGSHKVTNEPLTVDDSAAIASGITSDVPANTATSSSRARNRR